jgi:hypothetical protein
MRKITIFSSVVLLAAFCIVLASEVPGSSSAVINPSLFAFTTNGSVASKQLPHPEPGIYAAIPYSLLVVVPHPADDKMTVTPNSSLSKTPVVTPQSRLEKR